MLRGVRAFLTHAIRSPRKTAARRNLTLMGGEGLGPSLVEQGDVLDRRGQAARQDSVEWTPEASVYRVDGLEVFRTTRGISGVEEHLILSLTSKDFELKRLDPELLPSTMEVDWVRVWQRARS